MRVFVKSGGFFNIIGKLEVNHDVNKSKIKKVIGKVRKDWNESEK
jgi:hypothetical protein